MTNIGPQWKLSKDFTPAELAECDMLHAQALLWSAELKCGFCGASQEVVQLPGVENVIRCKDHNQCKGMRIGEAYLTRWAGK